MCLLCSTDKKEREKALEYQGYFANQLEQMAAYMRGLANGGIAPHSEDVKRIGDLSRSIIQELVRKGL